MAITYKQELITPELASKYLLANTKNFRKINWAVVRVYADDIKNGRWQHNHETIKFYEDGVLADGQHRLHAIVLAETPVRMDVIRGVKNDVTILDNGTNRTLRNYMSDFPPMLKSNTVTGAASIMLRGTFDARRVSKPEIMEYIKANAAELEEAAHDVRKGSSNPVAQKAPVLLAAFCLLKKGAGQLEDYFEVVNTGFSNHKYECSPAIVVRNFLSGVDGAANYNSPERKRLQFSATVTGYYDFACGRPRRKRYAFDKTALGLLDEVRRQTL